MDGWLEECIYCSPRVTASGKYPTRTLTGPSRGPDYKEHSPRIASHLRVCYDGITRERLIWHALIGSRRWAVARWRSTIRSWGGSKTVSAKCPKFPKFKRRSQTLRRI
eukprot:5200615-Pyramimonas_sp.AAC.2